MLLNDKILNYLKFYSFLMIIEGIGMLHIVMKILVQYEIINFQRMSLHVEY